MSKESDENEMDRATQASDALDILSSMRQSCESAICTLNDILLYDKIEAGTMVLEKRPIPVIQLLTETIKPFYLQVSLFFIYFYCFIYLFIYCFVVIYLLIST